MNKPNKEELFDLYITQNKSRSELLDLYKVGKTTFTKWLNEYGIKKDAKLVKENLNKSMLNTYGVLSIAPSKESVAKARATKLEKYGSETYNNRAKAKETVLLNYGVENISQAQEIKDKKKQTYLEHYGVENVFELDTVKAEIQETLLEKYGVDNPSKCKEFKDKAIATATAKYGTPTNSEKISKNNSRYVKDIKIVESNEEFEELLNDSEIDYEKSYNILNKIYDFKSNDILIEIDSVIHHNITNNTIDKMYHKYKSDLAEENGFTCIHLFDWDNPDLILPMLKTKTKIYARNCNVKKLTKQETDDFLKQYHFQGTCTKQEYSYGLVYNNELIEVMTFGKPRYNHKYQYELLRLCTKSGYSVIGGSKRLFHHFIDDLDPKSIISYCDKSKFKGDVYYSLGFYYDGACVGKHWYNLKTKQHVTDNLLRQRGYDQLFHTNYGKGSSNEDLMKEHGFVEIYDCGQATYIWKREG